MNRSRGATAGTRGQPAAAPPAPVPSRASVAGHPIHPMLIPLPIGLLVAALASDIAYTVTDRELFAEMAVWLVGGGLLTGALAMVAGAVDFFLIERARRSRAGKVHAWGNGVVLAVAAVNLATRLLLGAEAAIVPWGLALSALTGLLLAVTGWYGGELSYRLQVGVDPKPDPGGPVPSATGR